MRQGLLFVMLAALAGCTSFDLPEKYPSDVIAGSEFTTEPFRVAPDAEIYRGGKVRMFEITPDLTALHNLEACLPGTVVMEFMAAPDGRPVNIRIIDSQPPGAYDHVAYLALKDSRFTPTIDDGTWQPKKQQRPITFDVPARCR